MKNLVKNEIMRNERNYKSFIEFIEIVINFDDKLYKQIMKKHYNQFKDRAELIYESAAKYTKIKQQLYIKNLKYTEFASIKLNIIHRREEKNLKIKKTKERNYVTNVKRQIIS